MADRELLVSLPGQTTCPLCDWPVPILSVELPPDALAAALGTTPRGMAEGAMHARRVEVERECREHFEGHDTVEWLGALLDARRWAEHRSQHHYRDCDECRELLSSGRGHSSKETILLPWQLPREPDTCPRCRHAAHGDRACLNMASDGDCAVCGG